MQVTIQIAAWEQLKLDTPQCRADALFVIEAGARAYTAAIGK